MPQPPTQEYQVKAFIDIHSMRWTKEELKLIWGGHFDFALCDEKGILCLAIEYQGRGHYGKTEEEFCSASRRDIVKQTICEKTGVPLIQLDAEYAFIEHYKRLFQHFLAVFRDKRHNYAPVIALLSEQIALNTSNSIPNDSRLANLIHRLDIYEIQDKGGSVLGLLWDLHQIKTPLSPLPVMLDRLDLTK